MTCVAVVLFGQVQFAAAADSDPSGSEASPLALSAVSLKQKQRKLVLRIRTDGEWPLRALNKHPRGPRAEGQRYLCVVFRAKQTSTRMLCPGAANRGRAGILHVDGDKAERAGSAAVRVRRAAKNQIKVAFRPAGAGLRPGRFHWAVVSGWSGPSCASDPASSEASGDEPDGEGAIEPGPCVDRIPRTNRSRRGRVFEVRPAGCTRPGSNLVTTGPRGGKRIALTFDDGPWSYTPQILRTLNRKRVPGTFFVLGSLMRRGGGLMRTAARQGHELANHSYRHGSYPGSSDLRATNAVIERATGFAPCSFRPPYGRVNPSTVRSAAANGMRTVLWSVDTNDWQRPGAGTIAQRAISGARPGGIILMHDGGRRREQTAAALPRVINTLRSRGYRFVTVHELLGGRTLYAKVR